MLLAGSPCEKTTVPGGQPVRIGTATAMTASSVFVI
jgi:hypothetical protein